MKKILILSVTAGNGHNSCAKGMKKKLEELGGDQVEVKIIDTLKEFSTKKNYWIADSGYNFAVSKALPIYHICYNHYKRVSPDKRWSGGTQKTALSCTGGLLKEILEFKPDVIYCTHFYPAIAMTDLKLVYNLPCKVVVCNLDYVNSPFWESAIGVDYFVIPNEDFIEECLEEGFKKEQLLPYGITVDGRTLQALSREQARDELGLEKDLFTVMIMFGGGCWKGGMKIFKNILKSLKGRRAQVIMINGRNQKDYDRIQKMTFPEGIKVVNVGFTYEVPKYLASADVVVNKFGGTSVTEMLNVGRAMLITEKIPTQELYNLEYMKNKGVALSFKNRKQLKEKLLLLNDDENLRHSMEEKAILLRKNATVDTAKLMLGFENAVYPNVNFDFMGSLENKQYKDSGCKEIRKQVSSAVKKEHKNSIKKRKSK